MDWKNLCADADTAFTPDALNAKNPLLGHCTVASLVAQDVFGVPL